MLLVEDKGYCGDSWFREQNQVGWTVFNNIKGLLTWLVRRAQDLELVQQRLALKETEGLKASNVSGVKDV